MWLVNAGPGFEPASPTLESDMKPSCPSATLKSMHEWKKERKKEAWMRRSCRRMMKGRGKDEGYWKEGWENGKSFGERIG